MKMENVKKLWECIFKLLEIPYEENSSGTARSHTLMLEDGTIIKLRTAKKDLKEWSVNFPECIYVSKSVIAGHKLSVGYKNGKRVTLDYINGKWGFVETKNKKLYDSVQDYIFIYANKIMRFPEKDLKEDFMVAIEICQKQ